MLIRLDDGSSLISCKQNNGVIPVAIVSVPNRFDAKQLDPTSARFGPNGAREANSTGQLQDLNGDGLPVLMLHFRMSATGIPCGATQASLLIRNKSGQIFQATAPITTKP